jgi:alanine dehydrogenase
MRIGVPRERKDKEFRVGMVPEGVRQLRQAGHEILVERGAGEGSGLDDEAFARAGAQVVQVADVWSADLVVKVKEPQPDEFQRLRPQQVLFTYLHLAAAPDVAAALLDAGVVAIAYETIQNPDGSLPVLAPMSEVAGRLAVQVGVTLLQKDRGGKGLLLGGVPGVMRSAANSTPCTRTQRTSNGRCAAAICWSAPSTCTGGARPSWSPRR